jgi:hypothetical protein
MGRRVDRATVERAKKYLTDLIERLESDNVSELKVSYENGIQKIPNDDLGVYEYTLTGFKTITIGWFEKPEPPK